MPLRTTTVDLTEAADRLAAEKESKAEEQVDFPMGSDGARQVAQEGQRADRFLAGIAWARQQWDIDSVTFGALTNGERHLVRSIVDGTQETADAVRQNAYIAVGTREAPYLDHDPEKLTDPEELEAIKATIGNVADVHPAFADWAEAQIAELDRVGDDTGKSYRALVLEKRRQATSTGEHG